MSPRSALIENEGFLIQHFCNGLAGLICFRPDGASNPWSLHLMPLVQSSSLVLGAVESISTAHLHVLGSKPLSEAQSMQSNVLRALSNHIASEALDAQSAQLALAATLLMVYYEASARKEFNNYVPIADLYPGHTRWFCGIRPLPFEGRQSSNRASSKIPGNDFASRISISDQNISLF